MVRLFTTDYLPVPPTDLSVSYVPPHEYRSLLDRLECTRIFALLSFSDGSTRYTAIQNVSDMADLVESDAIYIPMWMLPMDVEIGNEVSIEFLSQEAFPLALSVTLRPLDSAFYNTEVKEELTSALNRLGLVRKEDTVMICLEGLDGYQAGFYIVACEPANCVLMDGEVEIQFEEAVDLWDGRRPATPIPPEVENMLVPATPVGNILGGGPVRKMPDGRPWNPYR
jgi:hypothetical protein